MQMIIDIPEQFYKELITIDDFDLNTLGKTVKNGTLLPKHHGRLIDADRVIAEMNGMKVGGEVFTTAVNYVKLTMKDAPTIIEADKEE